MKACPVMLAGLLFWLPPSGAENWRAEVVVDGLTVPTAFAFDQQGRLYLAETGLQHAGMVVPPRLLRLDSSGTVSLVSGELAAPLTDLRWHDGRLLAVQNGAVVSLGEQGPPQPYATSGLTVTAGRFAGPSPAHHDQGESDAHAAHGQRPAVPADRLVQVTESPLGDAIYVLDRGATMRMGEMSHAVPRSGVLWRLVPADAHPALPAGRSAPPAPKPAMAEHHAQMKQMMGGEAAGAERYLAILATDFRFFPNEVTIKPGEQVTLTLINQGHAPHDIALVLPEGERRLPEVIRGGQSGVMRFTAPSQPGRYHFYCPIGDHHDRGMMGYLIAEGQTAHAGHGSAETGAASPQPASAASGGGHGGHH